MSATKEAQSALNAVLGCTTRRTIAETLHEARELIELLDIPPERLATIETREQMIGDLSAVGDLSERAAVDIVLGQTVRECAPGLADWTHLEARLWRAGLMDGHADAWEALDALIDHAVDIVQRHQFGA